MQCELMAGVAAGIVSRLLASGTRPAGSRQQQAPPQRQQFEEAPVIGRDSAAAQEPSGSFERDKQEQQPFQREKHRGSLEWEKKRKWAPSGARSSRASSEAGSNHMAAENGSAGSNPMAISGVLALPVLGTVKLPSRVGTTRSGGGGAEG